MSELAYVAGKYEEAVHALAVGGGSIQRRIAEAARAGYGFPNPRVIPDEIRQLIDDLHGRLTKYPQVGDEGRYAATLARIQKKTAVSIAELIYDIAARLRGAVDLERRPD